MKQCSQVVIADTVGTSRECPHYQESVIAGVYFRQTSVVYFFRGFSYCRIIGVSDRRESRVDCTRLDYQPLCGNEPAFLQRRESDGGTRPDPRARRKSCLNSVLVMIIHGLFFIYDACREPLVLFSQIEEQAAECRPRLSGALLEARVNTLFISVYF